MKILIIDDSGVTRELIYNELVSLGFDGADIDQADNGATAIRKISDDAYDLFLVDLVMPGIDGVRVVKEIKDRRPQARIVVCSGCINKEAMEMLMLIGVHDFLGKPFTKERFRQAVVRNVASLYSARTTA